VSRSPRVARALTIAVVGAIGAAGCGVGAQSHPESIQRSDVPFDLATRSSESTTTTVRHGTSYTIYLVASDRLRGVSRSARVEPTPVTRLAALTDGPTAEEADAGLRTLLPPEMKVVDVSVIDRVATIGLSGADTAASAGDERALAIAQIVYTATAVPGVDRVRFEVDGKRAEVPRGDGRLTSGPVTRSDYALAAP